MAVGESGRVPGGVSGGGQGGCRVVNEEKKRACACVCVRVRVGGGGRDRGMGGYTDEIYG
jgi:hypothetical protein